MGTVSVQNQDELPPQVPMQGLQKCHHLLGTNVLPMD